MNRSPEAIKKYRKQINDKLDLINKEINELTLEWESLI